MPEEKTGWGGARPGAGRPKARYVLDLEAPEVELLDTALDAFGNDWYSHDRDPAPLDDLRAKVAELLAELKRKGV
jgi:hypothetical protein